MPHFQPSKEMLNEYQTKQMKLKITKQMTLTTLHQTEVEITEKKSVFSNEQDLFNSIKLTAKAGDKFSYGYHMWHIQSVNGDILTLTWKLNKNKSNQACSGMIKVHADNLASLRTFKTGLPCQNT